MRRVSHFPRDTTIGGDPCRRLRTLFSMAMRNATRTGPCIFLELFAGQASISGALRRMGFGCIAFELHLSDVFDLSNPKIIAVFVDSL